MYLLPPIIYPLGRCWWPWGIGCCNAAVQRNVARQSAVIPGEVWVQPGTLALNPERATLTLEVTNTAQRPIQVGSHYHFAETNDALRFDRQAARGMRLNIASGMAIRFEPGQTRVVTLVALSGARVVHGLRGLTNGAL